MEETPSSTGGIVEVTQAIDAMTADVKELQLDLDHEPAVQGALCSNTAFNDVAFGGWKELGANCSSVDSDDTDFDDGFSAHVCFVRNDRIYVCGGMNQKYVEAWNTHNQELFDQAQRVSCTFISRPLAISDKMESPLGWTNEKVAANSMKLPMLDGHAGVYVQEDDCLALISHQLPGDVLAYYFSISKWRHFRFVSPTFRDAIMYRASTPFHVELITTGVGTNTVLTRNVVMAAFGGIQTGMVGSGCVNELVFMYRTGKPEKPFMVTVVPGTESTPLPRMKSNLTAIGNTLYMYGGYSVERHREGLDPFLCDLQSWKDGVWTEITYTPPPSHGPSAINYRMNRSRCHILGIPEARGLLLGSGMHHQDFRADDLLFFDIDTSCWHVLDAGSRPDEAPQGPLKVTGAAIVSNPKDPFLFYVVGGGKGDFVAVAPVTNNVFAGRIHLSLRALAARKLAEVLDASG